MFNSTHTFVGLAIARAGPEKWVRYATATAVIASNLPDIDSAAGFWGTAAYLDHHRGLTHSLIGVPILALMLSIVMYFFSGKFGKTYVVALIAMATHPALDYLNSYGLRPFLPWSGNWYYGDISFILDPYMDTVLVLGLIAGSYWPNRRRLLTLVSLVIAVAYVGMRIQFHAMAMSNSQELATQVRGVENRAVLPNMWNPFSWDLIAASKTEVAKFEVCALPCDRIDAEPVVMNSGPSSQIVNLAARAPSAATFLSFARFPVTRVQPLASGYRVTFIDFRFYQEATNTALASEVTLDESLRVVNESVSFVHSLR